MPLLVLHQWRHQRTAYVDRGRAAWREGAPLGPVAQTRWGPVQVQVTIQNGRITNVTDAASGQRVVSMTSVLVFNNRQG